MGGINQLETLEAVVNPSEGTFGERLQRAKGLKILDIGSGNRVSMSLKKGDLYVMADPKLDPHASIMSGLNKREPGSQIVGFASRIADVPHFKPDLTLIIAPSPVDILEKDLLEEAARFLSGSRAVLVVLDTRTIDATINPRTLRPDNSGLALSKDKIVSTLRRFRFEVPPTRRGAADRIDGLLEEIGIQRSGVLNSEVLGGQEKVVVMGYR